MSSVVVFIFLNQIAQQFFYTNQNMEDIRREGGQRHEKMNRRDRKKQEQEMIHKMDLEKLQKAFGEKLILQEKVEAQKIEKLQNRDKYRRQRQYNQQQFGDFSGRGRRGREGGRGRGAYRVPQNHFQAFQDFKEQNESQSNEKQSELQNKGEGLGQRHRGQQERQYRGKWQKNNFQKKQGFQGNNKFYRGEGYEKPYRQQRKEGEHFQDKSERNYQKHRGHRHQNKEWKHQEGNDRQFHKKFRDQRPPRNDFQKMENRQQQRGRRQDRKKQLYENQRQRRQKRQYGRDYKREERQFKRNNEVSYNEPKQKVKQIVEEKKKPKQVEHPEYLLCPITQILMQSPYLLAVCGHTFEEAMIREWLVKQQKCPLCNKPATQQHLVKNFALAEVCRSFK